MRGRNDVYLHVLSREKEVENKMLKRLAHKLQLNFIWSTIVSISQFEFDIENGATTNQNRNAIDIRQMRDSSVIS